MASGHTSAQMALRDPDIRLMLSVRDNDDADAFAQLVDLYQHRLVSVMRHLVGSPEEAEDLAQEVFLRVFRTRRNYHPTAKFSTWLFTIANNLALNLRRDRKRRTTVPLDVQDSGQMLLSPAHRVANQRDRAPHHGIDQEELSAVVRRALDCLNERQKMAVILNKFEDMNYAEIADVMGLSTKAIKSLLSRARARLREELQPYIYMDGTPVSAGRDEDDE